MFFEYTKMRSKKHCKKVGEKGGQKKLWVTYFKVNQKSIQQRRQRRKIDQRRKNNKIKTETFLLSPLSFDIHS